MSEQNLCGSQSIQKTVRVTLNNPRSGTSFSHESTSKKTWIFFSDVIHHFCVEMVAETQTHKNILN